MSAKEYLEVVSAKQEMVKEFSESMIAYAELLGLETDRKDLTVYKTDEIKIHFNGNEIVISVDGVVFDRIDFYLGGDISVLLYNMSKIEKVGTTEDIIELIIKSLIYYTHNSGRTVNTILRYFLNRSRVDYSISLSMGFVRYNIPNAKSIIVKTEENDTTTINDEVVCVDFAETIRKYVINTTIELAKYHMSVGEEINQ